MNAASSMKKIQPEMTQLTHPKTRLAILLLYGLPGVGKSALARALQNSSQLYQALRAHFPNESDFSCLITHQEFDQQLFDDIDQEEDNKKKEEDNKKKEEDNKKKEEDNKKMKKKEDKEIIQTKARQKENPSALGDGKNSPFFQDQFFKSSRQKCYTQLEDTVKKILSSKPDRHFYLIIVDDNMFYKSMRTTLKQLCRKYEIGYTQLLVQSSIEKMLRNNSRRKGKAFVPGKKKESKEKREQRKIFSTRFCLQKSEQQNRNLGLGIDEKSIQQMANKFQYVQKNTWEETRALECSLEAIEDFSETPLVKFLMQTRPNLLTEMAGQLTLKCTPHESEEEKEEKRKERLRIESNFLHQLDVQSKKQVATFLKENPKAAKLGKQIAQARKEFFEENKRKTNNQNSLSFDQFLETTKKEFEIILHELAFNKKNG